MKILPIEKIKEADEFTIKNEPVADIDLMERAAAELFGWISANVPAEKKITIFCGLGNNGGDGFALARMLADTGMELEVNVLRYAEKMSSSCETNYIRLRNIPRIKCTEIFEETRLPILSSEKDIIVDAIFGSGLTRPVTGFIARVVDHINDSGAVVISIDVPTGFFCDSSNANNSGSVIHADYTLTFQFPKFGFLFAQNDKFVGHWEVLPIGLHPGFIEKCEVRNHLIECHDCKKLLKPRNKFSHKGTFGHGLLIAGGFGKMGAAVLSAKAAMRSGAGLITLHVPGSGTDVVHIAAPEIMVSIDPDEKFFSQVPEISSYSALAVGPGIGTGEKTQTAIKLLIQAVNIPIIFDADALNILSMNKTWISFVPKGSILTPHPKEFERLAGKSSDDFERNQIQREFSVKHHVYVVLKGAHTTITTPDGNCYFNSTGNPGMATGGSGDVLTGILLGLKAQGYSSLETCLLGVYLHGLAGNLAAGEWGFEALIAGNIIHYLGKAFKTIYSGI